MIMPLLRPRPCLLVVAALWAPVAFPCTHVTFRLAPETDGNSRLHDRSINDHARYILKGFAGDRAPSLLRDDGTTLSLACDALPATARKALDAAAPRGEATLDGLREAWQSYAVDARLGLGYGAVIPDTLGAFQAATSYRGWTKTVIASSRVKRAKRVLFESPAGFAPAVSVAETYPVDAPAGAAPREVEVTVARPGSGGDRDFYVYGPDGRLTDESEFPSGPQDAPTFCLGCHYDVGTRHFHRFLPRVP